MRVLITGARGFVGPHTIAALRRVCGAGVEIIATARTEYESSTCLPCIALDVTDMDAVRSVISHTRPSHVIHLAAMAATRDAMADPQNAWRVHVAGTLNVAQVILDEVPDCWLVHAGSGLIYGESAKSGEPLDETALLAPIDDYAVTKAAADLALGALAKRHLRLLRMRPFNHTGPGQTEAFAVPAFAAQVTRIEAGLMEPIIRVGNLDAERDFLDVRDVALAYALAVIKSDGLKSGTIFNIASGVPRRVGDILDWILRHSRVQIAIEQDPDRLRPSDLPRIVGDAGRIRQTLGWAPTRDFTDTLASVLDDWRRRVVHRESEAPC